MAYKDRIQRIAAQRKRAEAPKASDRRFGQYETSMRDIARSGEGLPGNRRPVPRGTKVTKALDQAGDMVRDIGKGTTLGAWDAARKMIGSAAAGISRAAENRKILGDAYTDKLRESVMTPESKAFYKRYMRLAASNPDRKEEYEKIARTALQNQQITNRINYGLGAIGADETPFEGYESYQPGFEGFEGETGPRFNLDNFKEGLFSSDAGRNILDQIDQAQAEERGDGAIGNALMNYGDAEAEKGGRMTYPTEDTAPIVDVETMDIPSAVIPQQSIGEREAWFDYLNERGFLDDFTYTPTPIDERTGDARIAEDIATENRLNPFRTPYLPIENYNPFRTPYPPVDPYIGVNPFKKIPYPPIELPIEEEKFEGEY